MLLKSDYEKNILTLRTIEHIKDDMNLTKGGFPLLKIMLILEFIVTMANKIFFKNDGEPKNKFQLILSIPAIVSFVKELLGMINKNVDRKPNARIGSSTAVDKAIKTATRRVKEYKRIDPK